MDMITTDVPLKDLHAVREANLPHEVTDPKGKTSGEEGLAVLGAPDEVNLEIIDGVRTVTI